jgi:hypothetical protein
MYIKLFLLIKALREKKNIIIIIGAGILVSIESI